MLGYYNYTVILTYIGMLFGFIGLTCAIDGQLPAAVLCLMLAGICDMFDGTVAATRKRDKYEKHFGIQIDSLSDLICFGVLPAVLLYRMNESSSLALFVAAVYVLCSLIRLAYFNVDEADRQEQTSAPRTIYRGLPVTLAALIIPALYQFGYILRLPTAKLCTVVMAGIAAAFLMPFPLKKPNIIGKMCVILCGGFELLFLLAGADI